MDTFADTISGAVGAVTSIYVGLPLDTIKVRLQTKGYLFRNALDCAVQTIRNEGILALWKGGLPALGSGLIENTVVFSANGLLYKMFVEKDEIPTFQKQCVLNGASAIFSGFSITPAECIKCRLQSSLGYVNEDSHFLSTIKHLYREEGITGFYRGLIATWIRDVPFYIVFFGTYTSYKSFIAYKYYNGDETLMNPLHYVMGGGIAGSTAWACIFPIDVIKSQQQTEPKRLSIYQTTKQIVKNYGFKKLYTGFLPCIMRGFPANGALFLSMEFTKKLLNYLGMTSGHSLGS